MNDTLSTSNVAHQDGGGLTTARVVRTAAEPIFRLAGRRPSRIEFSLDEIKRVLVVRPDRIGDVIATLPLLREIRRNLPDSKTTLVVQPRMADLVVHSPFVDDVLTYEWRLGTRLKRIRRPARFLGFAARHLWHSRFDLAIVPRWDTDKFTATYIAYWSGAPWRVGYSEVVTNSKAQRNKGYDALLTHVLHGDHGHEVERNLRVLQHLGGTIEDDRLELQLAAEDESFAERCWREHGLRQKDCVIACCPGATAERRQWPAKRFAELARHLADQHDARILIVGGPSDRALGAYIDARSNGIAIDMTGKASLRETAALLRKSNLYVGNDTGPMHLAAAVGIPVVELSSHPADGSEWHMNSPRRWGPWRVPSEVLQPRTAKAPCTDACVADSAHCITGISVEEAAAAVGRLVDQFPRDPEHAPSDGRSASQPKLLSND